MNSNHFQPKTIVFTNKEVFTCIIRLILLRNKFCCAFKMNQTLLHYKIKHLTTNKLKRTSYSPNKTWFIPCNMACTGKAGSNNYYEE